jgi:hypothetical protein
LAGLSRSYYGVGTTVISDDLVLTPRRHPASVEAMVALTQDIVATGSEDGMIRVMQVHPNKFRKSRHQFVGHSSPFLVGVIATHGDFPIERMRLDRNSRWLGSVSHDDTLKLTDVADLFEDSDDEGGEDESKDEGDDVASETTEKPAEASDADSDSDAEMTGADGDEVDHDGDTAMEDTQNEDSDDSDAAEDRRAAKKAAQRQKKKERKMGVGLLVPKEEKNKEQQSGAGFFDDL